MIDLHSHTHNIPYSSPRQGSSNAIITNTIQNPHETKFQTITPTTKMPIRTPGYAATQTSLTNFQQPVLTTNTTQSNRLSNHMTSRTLFRPPLQTILIRPLTYRLTSTNM